MARAVVITGGNRGAVAGRLERAAALLEERAGGVTARSSVCRSRAWGFEAEEEFLNQVVVVQTEREPSALLDILQAIERELGRDRREEAREKAASGQRYASRPIDIDLLLYDRRVIGTERLQVPHPRMGERTFVLRPLCEVMGSERHPVTGERFDEMLAKAEKAEKAATEERAERDKRRNKKA